MRSSASNRNISFLPELIDVALLGWVIWEGTERGTFAGTREAAGCFQRPLQQSRLIKILRPSPAVNSKEKKRHPADTNSANLGARNWPKCVFTQVTNWAGKAACFRQLMRAKSQTSVGVFKS